MKDILYNKYKDWKYEEEYRGWVDLDEKDKSTGLYFMEFSKDLRLREIIAGPRCQKRLRELHNIIKPYIKEVELLKARLAFKSYSVVPNNSYKRMYT